MTIDYAILQPRPAARMWRRVIARRPRTRKLGAPMLGLVLLLSGCGGGEEIGVAPLVRDSSGVRIVENSSPTWADGSAWYVESEPTVSIGLVEGEAAYLFNRLAGATMLSARRIEGLDEGSAELRVFDPDGRFLAATGRLGGGPGEFAYPPRQLIRTIGDTLLVVAAWEVSRFGPDLGFGDRAAIDREPAAALMPPGRFGEGVYLLPDGGFLTPARERTPSAPSNGRRPGGYILVTAAGEATLIEGFPSFVTSVYAAGGTPPRLAIGNDDSYEISIFTSAGNFIQRIRNTRPNDAFSSEEIERTCHAGAVRRPPGEAAAWRSECMRRAFPDTHPAFQELFVDRTSHLWVRRRLPASPDEIEAMWDVYSPDGLLLGVVVLPAMLFEIYDIGHDFVLGAFIGDELGTQQVRLYDLRRP
jgi:hypothetical protein